MFTPIGQAHQRGRDGGRGQGQHRGNPRGRFQTREVDMKNDNERGLHGDGLSGRAQGHARGRGRPRGRGHGHPFGNAPRMRVSQMEDLLKRHPADVLMALAIPSSGFQVTLQESDRDTVSAVIMLVAKACQAVGKQESLNHILQQINTSGFLMGPVIMYITRVMMSPMLVKHDVLNSICDMLKYLLDRIPAASSDNVTPVLAQLKALHATIHKGSNADAFGKYIAELEEQQTNVVRQIQGGFMVKQVARHNDEDDAEPPDNFRQIPVTPTGHDLRGDIEPFLRKNRISGSYRDVDQYLDIQFRLLREDYLMPLRQGIKELKRAGSKVADDRYIQDVRIYNDVQNMGFWYSEKGVVCRLCFDNSKLKKVRWEISRRLIFGSLVCLSADNFTTFVIGTVAERDPKLLSKGLIDILIHDIRHFDPNYFIQYKMVECSAYFEAYRHNLQGLQDLNDTKLPFKDYLLNTRSLQADPPRYLIGNDSKYDFKPIMKTRLPEVKRRVLKTNDWPTAPELGLDDSQYKALQLALTREFAIIQGPPGTGKTFIGLRIVQLLLHNFDVWGIGLRMGERLHRANCPILLVCYTNHALDQFLEGILQFTEYEAGNIIRVGGRSKTDNEDLQKCLLSQIKKNREIRIPQELREAKGALLDQLKGLETNLTEIGQMLTMTRTSILHERQLLCMMSPHHKRSFEHLMGISNECFMYKWLLEAPQQMVQEASDHTEQWDEGMDTDGEEPFNMRNHNQETNTADAMDVVVYEDQIRQIEAERQMDDSGDEMKEERIGAKSRRTLDESSNIFSEHSGTPKKRKGKTHGPNEWKIVRSKKNITNTLHRELNKQEQMSEQEEAMAVDIFALPADKRWNLYRLWRHRFSQDSSHRMATGIEQFNQLARRLKEIRDEEDYHMLMNAKVIAMTTTAAAKYQNVLSRVQPRIVIVEEAAEVLEAHIITSLSESCQHLILIGDHQQLRPNPTVYKLAKKYHLEISLFERMLMNNMHCECLGIQHRMRPEIVKLIVPHIYKSLVNHESVLTYENISGIQGNLFFIEHEHAENRTFDTRSRTNAHEAEYLTALCRYLLLQGYEESQITILTTYTGQMFEIKRLVRQDPLISGVIVTPVDNYQGEENDIILLSLVRSNEEGNIGFLKTANRVCVALSRAKKGIYVIGDMKLMRESSMIWSNILEELEAEEKIVKGLPLFCQNHPDTGIFAENVEDFTKAPNGGCSRPCEFRLRCGHVCGMMCHPADPDHKKYICEKSCIETPCPQKHKCPKKCYEECGLCEVLVKKVMPKCGHELEIPCHINPVNYECTYPCERILLCAHICPNKCGVCCITYDECRKIVEGRTWPCGHVLNVECCRNKENYPCPTEVEKTLPCGHNMKMECAEDTANSICETIVQLVLCERKCQNYVSCSLKEQIISQGCQVILEKTCDKNVEHKFNTKCFEFESAHCKCPCAQLLPCGHKCQGVCGACTDTGIHKSCECPCRRVLLCGHQCRGRCGEPCPPCRDYCRKACPHGYCRNLCGDQCFKCRAPCAWRCPHTQCTRLCSQECDRQPCNRPCQRPLPCGHRCTGYCGEPCPGTCLQCHYPIYHQMHNALKTPIKQDRYVLLLPCNHVITSTYMDNMAKTYLDDVRSQPRELKIFHCPMCTAPIHYCPRYQHAVRLSQQDMEKMKQTQHASNACHKVLSGSDIGRELAKKMKTLCDDVTSPGQDESDLRICLGCIGLLNETSSIINKIRHAKEKIEVDVVVRLNKTYKAYDDELKKTIMDGSAMTTQTLSSLPLKLALFYMQCVLWNMLTYVRSYYKRNSIREILVGIQQKSGASVRSSMRQMLITANTRITASIPIGLRNGVEDYTKDIDRHFSNHVDFILEKKWVVCKHGKWLII